MGDEVHSFKKLITSGNARRIYCMCLLPLRTYKLEKVIFQEKIKIQISIKYYL